MGRKRLSDDIYEDLEKKILNGYYNISDRLPSERELADMYNTSRIPIRSALARLRESGYIRTLPGSGTMILSQGAGDRDELSRVISQGGQYNPGFIIAETIHLRALLEAEGARKAAQNRDADDIKQIQAALFKSIEEMRKFKMGDSNAFLKADYASKDPLLLSCFDAMRETITFHQYWSLQHLSLSPQPPVAFHTLIYESILGESETEAYESMKSHLMSVYEVLTKSELTQ